MLNFVIYQLGVINKPDYLANFGDVESGGLGKFLNVILNTMIVGAGIYSLFNFLSAGYAFMSAGGEPKKIQDAWARIWQTAMGLAFAAGSYILAAIFGKIIFNDYTFILSPKIQTVLPTVLP